MPNKPTPNSPEELWQNQTEEETNLTLADIRSKALNFQRKIQRRNLREYIGFILAAVVYAGYVWYLPGILVKAGAAMTLAGMCFSVYYIRRHGSARETPVDSPASECLEFHRRELTRQRDMLRGVGPKHIGPVIPGLALFFVGMWLANVDSLRDAIVFAVSGIFVAAVFTFIYWLNVRAANKLDRDIAALGH